MKTLRDVKVGQSAVVTKLNGEGATKMFQVDVSGMPDKDTARHLAKAIVASN